MTRVRETASALLLAAVGLLFCAGGFRMGIGSAANPGEGFLPVLAGAALLLLSLAHAVRRVLAVRSADGPNPFWPERGSQFRVAAVLLSILFYSLAFETVGFAVATLILFLFLLKTIDPVRWSSAILISLATTVAAFVLFQVWLQVQLPEGWVSWWGMSRWIF